MAAQLYDTVWKKEVLMDRTIEHKTSSLNLLRHGILSDHAVLPWEDVAEYDALLKDLITEYEPIGPAERSLVVELAQIFIKRRRLRAAEKAIYQKELNDFLNPKFENFFPNDNNKVIATAINKTSDNYGPSSVSLSKIYHESDQDITRSKREIRAHIAGLKKARDLCNDDHPMAYKRALSLLSETDQDNWKNVCEDEEYQPTCEYLASWLDEYIDEQAHALNELNNRPAIREYLQGRAFPSEKTFAPLMRYETHLDRKFERTVAMLLKLKTLRTDPQIIFNA